MKKLIFKSLAIITLFAACEKKNASPIPPVQKTNSVEEKCGPYGKTSRWLSVGGDTIFTDTLTLTYFYTEITTPNNIYYYQQNISFWNDYDYTFPVPENTIAKDTLVFTDIDSGRKAVFKRQK